MLRPVTLQYTSISSEPQWNSGRYSHLVTLSIKTTEPFDKDIQETYDNIYHDRRLLLKLLIKLLIISCQNSVKCVV